MEWEEEGEVYGCIRIEFGFVCPFGANYGLVGWFRDKVPSVLRMEGCNFF